MKEQDMTQPAGVVEALRQALIGTSVRDLDDGPCWCLVPPNRIFPDHEKPCQASKAALAATPAHSEPFELIRDLVQHWDAGDLDHDYDAISSAFDSAREYVKANGELAGPPALDTADHALAVPHREDEQACGCDGCMEYAAEDEGADWYRLSPARRIVLRVLDSGDDRLAPLATAFREHEDAYAAETSEPSE